MEYGMNKWIFTIAALFCAQVFAYEPGIVKTLSAKATLKNTQGFFVLSDGSCWKVIPFEKRWRSFSEWWEGIELNVPEDYECLPKDWNLGAEIEVYPKSFATDVDEYDAYNQKALKQCTHLLCNRNSEEVLFAIEFAPWSFMAMVFNNAYSEGHDVGWKKGHNAGYSEGYQNGYNQGISEY